MDALGLVKTLIGFDTTSRGSNLELIAYARALLEKSGARCRITPDASGQKANLFASWTAASLIGRRAKRDCRSC